MVTTGTSSKRVRLMLERNAKRNLPLIYALVGVPFLLYVFIAIVPLCVSVFYSLLKWDGIGAQSFAGLKNYVTMAFHCGNTPICHLQKGEMKYQLIMKRALEPDSEPNITRGTLEGDMKPGEITFFRLQGAADATLHSYIAQGEILPVPTGSFGGIGVFAIPEMARFYRHALLFRVHRK